MLYIPDGEREKFKKRCEARGMTMQSRLRMLMLQDEWDFQENPPRQLSEQWLAITSNNRRAR